MYFEDARDHLLKELVDFESREDFDKFMSNIENTYFETVVPVAKNPYQTEDEIPSYPPVPYKGFSKTDRNRQNSPQSDKHFDNFV